MENSKQNKKIDYLRPLFVMKKGLKEIKRPVESELREFEVRFKEDMSSNTPLLDKITYYIVQRKGKQVRPILVFLSAKISGTINDSTYRAASFIELLHTATLVHDDVVDDADERRGYFSVNAIWKNKIAVLVGDYFLSKGLLLAVDNREFELLQIISTAVRDMSEGELLQIEKARKLDIDESVYYEIIRMKTASLIAAACAAGAASATDTPETTKKMRSFGEKIGLAFQIKDDLFDYGDTDVGKPRGIDIKEKKMTLPLIFALNQSTRKEKRKIINIIKNHSENKSKVQEVIRFVKEKGGLDYAREKMNEFKEEALNILHTFPESEARKSLEKLVFYITERAK